MSPVSQEKTCKDCGEQKRLDDFPRNARRPDGRGMYCHKCIAVRQRASREKKAAAEGRTLRVRREVPEGHRYCPDCAMVKPLEDFPRNKSGRQGRGGYCKPCHNAKGKATYTRLYGSTREYHLRRRYGITGADYDAAVEAQGGVCPGCGGEPQHVDHDHRTGKVRGILCFNCNQALGNVRDDVTVLARLIAYLGSQRPVEVAPVVDLFWEVRPRFELSARGHAA
jgi:hypothetical protein